MEFVNPVLAFALIACGCFGVVLYASPKAAENFIHWLSEVHTGKDAARIARRQYRIENGLDRETA